MHPRGLLVAFAALFAAVEACGPPTDARSDGWTQSVCASGQREPCTCAGGVSGSQTCGADAAFGVCVCTDGGNTPVCSPGSTVPCGCAGGASSVQVCNEQGTAISACECGADAGAG